MIPIPLKVLWPLRVLMFSSTSSSVNWMKWPGLDAALTSNFFTFKYEEQKPRLLRVSIKILYAKWWCSATARPICRGDIRIQGVAWTMACPTKATLIWGFFSLNSVFNRIFNVSGTLVLSIKRPGTSVDLFWGRIGSNAVTHAYWWNFVMIRLCSLTSLILQCQLPCLENW